MVLQPYGVIHVTSQPIPIPSTWTERPKPLIFLLKTITTGITQVHCLLIFMKHALAKIKNWLWFAIYKKGRTWNGSAFFVSILTLSIHLHSWMIPKVPRCTVDTKKAPSKSSGKGLFNGHWYCHYLARLQTSLPHMFLHCLNGHFFPMKDTCC